MCSRARRLGADADVEAFAWPHLTEETASEPWVAAAWEDAALSGAGGPAPLDPEDSGSDRRRMPDAAAVEREAYARGYGAGEQAGSEAALARLEGLHRRFAQSLEDFAATRHRALHDAERQVVQLALAIARRVILHECTTHPEIVAAIAHAAIDRLGASDGLTLRMHPTDAAALSGVGLAVWPPRGTVVCEDPALERGGVIVESAGGTVDAGLAAQLDEIARVLLGDVEARPVSCAVHAADAQDSLRPGSRATTVTGRGEAA
jgi:flagellar biosynthesis/type III secretory pathway protein FliH